MRHIIEPGNPAALREASEKWTSEVSKMLGTIAGELNLDNHQTKIEWEGRAAEAYKGLVPEQVEGVNGLESVSDHMVSALDELANTIVTFWVAIGVAVVTFVVGMVAAIAACVGVVTAPAGIAAAVGVAAVCLGLVTAAITALVAMIQSISSSAKSTKQQVDELGSTWEKSDAGVDYGDESNWEPQAG